MTAYVETVDGAFAIDLETAEVEAWDGAVEAPAVPGLNLPRLVAAAAAGSTIAAVVDARPPLAVSHDAGATWRASGRGLPHGNAVAICQSDPDTIVFAARNRLYVSRDGGVFWTALGVDLPEIRIIELG